MKIYEKYDTLVFDMDGVMTSEQNYWNCAALTVMETFCRMGVYLNTPINPEQWMHDVKSLRAAVFCNDRTIRLLKDKGVNSNWDLGYIIVCIGLAENTADYERIYRYAENMGDNILDEYKNLAAAVSNRMGGGDYRRNSLFWKFMQDCFQEWFLGDELFEKTYNKKPKSAGKIGLINEERPVVDLSALRTLIHKLSKSKIRLAVGTGRPLAEIYTPLKQWGIIDSFAEDGLITYDDVIRAEVSLNNPALTKPHPYMFIKALMGSDYPDIQAAAREVDPERAKRTLVVGDAGADMLAARAAGMDFCAVLTGISGQSAGAYFKENGADYILDSVLKLGDDI